jgi:hypothetical protein
MYYGIGNEKCVENFDGEIGRYVNRAGIVMYLRRQALAFMFAFGKSRVQIFACGPAVLTEVAFVALHKLCGLMPGQYLKCATIVFFHIFFNSLFINHNIIRSYRHLVLAAESVVK